MAFPEGHKGLSGLMPGKDGKLPKISESKRPEEGKEDDPKPEESGEKMSSMHEHPDGTFHTMKDGDKEEHPDMGHALMAMAAHHKPEGKHVHAHHDGMSVHTHGISEGQHEGPTEHGSTEEATQHMGDFMNGGEQQSEEPQEEAQDHEGLSGFGG